MSDLGLQAPEEGTGNRGSQWLSRVSLCLLQAELKNGRNCLASHG